jgi:hypothetical protein
VIHLQKFIDRVQGTEARGLRDMSIPLSDAKAMSAEITRILLELQSYREQMAAKPAEEIIQVSIEGGTFK